MLFAVGLVLLLALGGYVYLAGRGTFFIKGGWGFVGITRVHDAPIHHVDTRALGQVLASFCEAVRFDMLWVSKENDEYTGVMLVQEDGTPELSVFFYTDEPEKISSFRTAMERAGFFGDESSNGLNGGRPVTDFAFKLPNSTDALAEALDVSLSNLQPEQPEGYYVRASRTASGPGAGTGVRYAPNEDPLAELL